MRLWADVQDANGVKIGTVTTLSNASVTRALDNAGQVSLTFNAADENALDLLTVERRVVIYVEHDDRPREVGRGVIRDVSINDSKQATASGPDSLDALKRRSVLLGRKFDNVPIATIAAQLVNLVPGWSILVSATGNQSARFDGASVLRALLRQAEEKGLHLREGSDPYTLEMGAFGDDSGVVAVQPGNIAFELYGNDDVVIIDRLTEKTSSKDVINRVYPIGAGEGKAALTLRNSDYTASSVTGPDGEPLYYLEDAESIAQYGRIEKFVTFKEIIPLENSAVAKVRAANMLYDAAYAWLQRNKQPVTTYSLNIRKVRQVIRPGDKIRVVFKGLIEKDGGTFSYLNVNEMMWVLRVTEQVGESGNSLSLEVATVDRVTNDTAQIVVSALEAINVRNIAVTTSSNSFSYAGYDYIQGLNFAGGPSGYNAIKDAEFVFTVDDTITDVTRVSLNFKTLPLFGTLRQWVTGVNWYHIWQVVPGYNYPTYLQLSINGVDVTSALGGPWGGAQNTAGSAVDVTVDITDYILAAANLYQRHEISLSCGYYTAETRVDGSEASNVNSQASNGVVLFAVTVQGVVQNG